MGNDKCGARVQDSLDTVVSLDHASRRYAAFVRLTQPDLVAGRSAEVKTVIATSRKIYATGPHRYIPLASLRSSLD